MPAVIPTAGPAGDSVDEQPARAAAVPAAKTSTKRIKDGQTQLSAYVDIAISEEARDAMMYLANQPEGPVNLSDLVNQALHREVGRLRTEHHGGRPFPRRRRPLPVGRPI